MITKRLSFLMLIVALVISNSAFAHRGRTDGQGCHVERSTGKQHCH
jgi:hypothetical protein